MNDLKPNRPTILLLDDHMINLTLTASMLNKVNINTIQFQESLDALSYLYSGTNTIDVIIQDIVCTPWEAKWN